MKKVRVIIAGGRDFCNWKLPDGSLDTKRNTTAQQRAFRHISTLLMGNYSNVEIVSGAALGADRVGENFARGNGVGLRIFPANWTTHGNYAGPIRNEEMGDYATHLIAFWDGYSRGTKHMIDYARKMGLMVRVIRYDNS